PGPMHTAPIYNPVIPAKAGTQVFSEPRNSPAIAEKTPGPPLSRGRAEKGWRRVPRPYPGAGPSGSGWSKGFGGMSGGSGESGRGAGHDDQQFQALHLEPPEVNVPALGR